MDTILTIIACFLLGILLIRDSYKGKEALKRAKITSEILENEIEHYKGQLFWRTKYIEELHTLVEHLIDLVTEFPQGITSRLKKDTIVSPPFMKHIEDCQSCREKFLNGIAMHDDHRETFHDLLPEDMKEEFKNFVIAKKMYDSGVLEEKQRRSQQDQDDPATSASDFDSVS